MTLNPRVTKIDDYQVWCTSYLLLLFSILGIGKHERWSVAVTQWLEALRYQYLYRFRKDDFGPAASGDRYTYRILEHSPSNPTFLELRMNVNLRLQRCRGRETWVQG